MLLLMGSCIWYNQVMQLLEKLCANFFETRMFKCNVVNLLVKYKAITSIDLSNIAAQGGGNQLKAFNLLGS